MSCFFAGNWQFFTYDFWAFSAVKCLQIIQGLSSKTRLWRFHSVWKKGLERLERRIRKRSVKIRFTCIIWTCYVFIWCPECKSGNATNVCAINSIYMFVFVWEWSVEGREIARKRKREKGEKREREKVNLMHARVFFFQFWRLYYFAKCFFGSSCFLEITRSRLPMF